MQLNAFFTCSLCSGVIRITLVSECKFYRLSGYVLELTRRLGYLCALLLVGRRNVRCEQQAQCIDSHMDLASALAFMPVVTRADSFRMWTAAYVHPG